MCKPWKMNGAKDHSPEQRRVEARTKELLELGEGLALGFGPPVCGDEYVCDWCLRINEFEEPELPANDVVSPPLTVKLKLRAA